VITVSGPEQLNAFRNEWSGQRILELLDSEGGKVLIGWPTGIGKSTSLDDVLEAAVNLQRHDLVVVVAPTRAILNERRWVITPPNSLRILYLRPRPQQRCGPELNDRWRKFEAKGLGTLGRIELCGSCPRLRGCPWPDQYGKRMKGTQVVFATSAHLHRSPIFLLQLMEWTGATRPLVLLDEVAVIMSSFRRRISRHELIVFLNAMQEAKRQGQTRRHEQ
jgi:hypothetical protein